MSRRMKRKTAPRKDGGRGTSPRAPEKPARGVKGMRRERDPLGEVLVPEGALYGPQTTRALRNFKSGGRPLPWRFVLAQLDVKEACAKANRAVGVLDGKRADAIASAIETVRAGGYEGQFTLDYLQAGAGTSQNMNANEVLASLASKIARLPVHPNDHVNASQSTNDVFPTAMQLALYRDLTGRLAPALSLLADELNEKSREFSDVWKSGRTHLQDAVPMTLGEELSGYAGALTRARGWVNESAQGLLEVPLGGNAVGRGTNAPEGYRGRAVSELAKTTGIPFRPAQNPFEAVQNPNAVLHAVSAVGDSAIIVERVCSDLILLSSGPRTGLGELVLPPLQPGSSFMPGKVNPVVPEMARMASAHARGCCHSVRLACSHGTLELNVSMPVIANDSLEATETLAGAAESLALDCVGGMAANIVKCAENAEATLGSATLLAPSYGYMESARLAKIAHDLGEPLDAVVSREKGLPIGEARRLLGIGVTRRKR